MIDIPDQTKIQWEYLSLTIEECAEVIQAASKINRFGANKRWYGEGYTGESNLEMLAREVGELLEVLENLNLPKDLIYKGRLYKRKRLEQFGPEAAKSLRED